MNDDIKKLEEAYDHMRVINEESSTNALSENRQMRLTALRDYVRKMRDNTPQENKNQREIYTNVLAWIILIQDDE